MLDGTIHFIKNPNQFPSSDQTKKDSSDILFSHVKCFYEPVVEAVIIAPDKYTSQLMSICQDRRSVQLEMNYVDSVRVKMRYKMPLGEIIHDFYDQLKTVSQGYASFDYNEIGYEASDIVRVSSPILLVLCFYHY